MSNPSPIAVHPARPPYWRKCTTCKKPISFSQKYWVCSVSTCNRVRTDLVFCDLRCFDAHVPVLNHRDAGAFERTAPSEKAFLQAQQAQAPQQTSGGVRTSPPQQTAMPQGSPRAEFKAPPSASTSPSPVPSENAAIDPHEILVVASKVKAYIRAQSSMNTAESTLFALSDFVRKWADQAVERAKKEGFKTVMDRHIP